MHRFVMRLWALPRPSPVKFLLSGVRLQQVSGEQGELTLAELVKVWPYS